MQLHTHRGVGEGGRGRKEGREGRGGREGGRERLKMERIDQEASGQVQTT